MATGLDWTGPGFLDEQKIANFVYRFWVVLSVESSVVSNVEVPRTFLQATISPFIDKKFKFPWTLFGVLAVNMASFLSESGLSASVPVGKLWGSENYEHWKRNIRALLLGQAL
jgi:hypothetical protein